MIISVHLPKTAGRSFRDLLKSHYKKSYRDDYDNPLDTPKSIRIQKAQDYNSRLSLYQKYVLCLKGVKCIHGHFLPFKYDYFKEKNNHHFVTWLREPIDRLVSNYFYRMNNYIKDHNESLVDNSFHSFKDYCLLEESINVYDQYLFKFPITNFSFVGIVEHFDTDLKYFAKNYLNETIESAPKKNQTANKVSLKELKDPVFVEWLKNLNAKDYKIYNQALELRRLRSDEIN